MSTHNRSRDDETITVAYLKVRSKGKMAPISNCLAIAGAYRGCATRFP